MKENKAGQKVSTYKIKQDPGPSWLHRRCCWKNPVASTNCIYHWQFLTVTDRLSSTDFSPTLETVETLSFVEKNQGSTQAEISE